MSNAIKIKNLQSISANVDSNQEKNNRQHESFVPMVAFQCGYKNKFIDEKDGEWHDDSNSDCLQEKYAILKYCQKVYPNKEITNIVEYSHLSHIEKWCKEDSKKSNCKHKAIIRPYRCIGKIFDNNLKFCSWRICHRIFTSSQSLSFQSYSRKK